MLFLYRREALYCLWSAD